MGYYINHDSKGNELPAKDKVRALIADGAKLAKPQYTENLICVVDNTIFEAAGYCYSEKEFDEFNHNDGRDKTWLTHPLAKQLSNF